jgi:hypothetical protein
MGEPKGDEIVTADSLTMALRTAFRQDSVAAASLDFQMQVGSVELRAQVSDGELSVVQISPPSAPAGGSLPSGEPELRFATGPGIRDVIAGTLTPAHAVKQDVVTILKGDLGLFTRFAELFRIDTQG